MLGSNPLAESSPRRVDAEGKCNGRGGRESPARHLPLAFGHNAINPGGFGGRAPKNSQHLFFHSFTKLNLTNIYAIYAEPKHSLRFMRIADNRYPQLAQLPLRDIRWGTHHQVLGLLIHREQNHLANVRLVSQ